MESTLSVCWFSCVTGVPAWHHSPAAWLVCQQAEATSQRTPVNMDTFKHLPAVHFVLLIHLVTTSITSDSGCGQGMLLVSLWSSEFWFTITHLVQLVLFACVFVFYVDKGSFVSVCINLPLREEPWIRTNHSYVSRFYFLSLCLWVFADAGRPACLLSPLRKTKSQPKTSFNMDDSPARKAALPPRL